MAWCTFYESRGQSYFCAKKDEYIDWATYDKYCKNNSSRCPLFNKNDEDFKRSTGCFLTTACVQARNLSDDCDELQTLRYFRDKCLNEVISAKTDVARYYEVAPAIVSAIDKLPNHNEIYNNIYKNIVLDSIRLIKANLLEDAYILYRNAVLELESKYITKS